MSVLSAAAPRTLNRQMAGTTAARTTRRRSRAETSENDSTASELPAPKRRREDKTQALAVGKTTAVNGPPPKKKSKQEYTEEDDGFTFIRKSRATSTNTATTRSTRSATLAVSPVRAPSPPPPPQRDPSPSPPPPPKRTTKVAKSRNPTSRTKKAAKAIEEITKSPPSSPPIIPAIEPVMPSQQAERRRARQTKQLPASSQQQGGRHNDSDHHHHYNHHHHLQVFTPKRHPDPAVEKSMVDAGLRPVTPPPIDPEGVMRKDLGIAKVLIPSSDTPIIQRNKQFRKDGTTGGGSRRSSLGLRGRRASSLMDNGQLAEPHADLEPENYYKHIDADMVEPRRMKQLLVWCAKRASNEPPVPAQSNAVTPADNNAHAIAKLVQESLLADLLEKPELSNWFKRKDEDVPVVEKKPNPRNVENEKKIAECEETLARLQAERHEWEALLKSPTSAIPLPTVPTAPTEDPSSATDSGSLVESTTTYLSAVTAALEPTVDAIDASVHQLTQLRKRADEAADQVFAEVGRRIEERDRRVKRDAGTEGLGLREVLRSLSRMGEGGASK